MKIALLQTDIQWLDAASNCREATRLMDTAPDADLYVLPEMWATGFCTEPTDEMAAQGENALAWMCAEARRRRCAVAGSVAVRLRPEGATGEAVRVWRNRFYFVRDDGTFEYYDKRNLFVYGAEHRCFSPGERPVVVAWRGVRLGLQVCFDLRFPETGRNRLSEAYDVLLYVANWPSTRRMAWDLLLPARAVENQAYVVGVNRTGTDPYADYNGGSAVIDPMGREVLRLEGDSQTGVFEPDLLEVERLRQSFKVLR